MRLLLEGGLYAKSWVCKTHKSGLEHVNESETWHCDCSKSISNANKHLASEKWKDLVLHLWHKAVFFELRLLFECGLCATWVRRKCGFYSSAASNQVRLLYTTLRQMLFLRNLTTPIDRLRLVCPLMTPYAKNEKLATHNTDRHLLSWWHNRSLSANTPRRGKTIEGLKIHHQTFLHT